MPREVGQSCRTDPQPVGSDTVLVDSVRVELSQDSENAEMDFRQTRIFIVLDSRALIMTWRRDI